MAVPVVGSLLIFSLLIGPPAAARSFTNRPPVAIGLSVLFALVTVWVAIAVSYETNLPIGFFVGAISAFAYTVGRAWAAWRQTSVRRRDDVGTTSDSDRPCGAGCSNRGAAMTQMTSTRAESVDFGPLQLERGRTRRRVLERTRNTPRKRALLEVLEVADGFLSAAELHRRVCSYLVPQGLRVGIATVYSQLRSLAQSGAVDTLHGDDGETRYWLPRGDAHHHYLVCRSCGRALEIVAGPVEEWDEAVGATVGFREVTYTLELFGLCDRCAERHARSERHNDGGRGWSSRDQSEQRSVDEDGA